MKKLLLIISAIAIIMALVLSVNAHPGRTDGNGGHTDHSTGEYHYHHGYPAHDHYDMDGDGDLDCPYDFDDQTNHNSDGGHSSNETDSYIPSLPTEEPTAKSVTFGDVLWAIVKYLIPSIVIGSMSSYLLSMIVHFIFDEEKGCTISIVLFIVITIASHILLIIYHLS